MTDAWIRPSLSIDLSSSALGAIQALKFSEPTPVQRTVIPLLLSNKDVAAEAVTGSGKTIAFLLPAFELLTKRSRPWKSHEMGCLIISPTYELALQIFDVLRHFQSFYVDSLGRPLFTSLVFTGGDVSGASMTRTENLDAFLEQGATLLVATPGRLVDLLQQKHGGVGNPLVRALSSLEVLILDEADRLLEMGFEKQINQILSLLPKQRRTGLFSATQTTELEDLLRAGLRNPVRVIVKEQVEDAISAQRTPLALENYYTVLGPDEKLCALVNFLLAHPSEKLLVFMATCACVDYFSRVVRALLPKARAKHIYALHGKLRKKRSTIFNTFRGDDAAILICTDVMARGIDVPGVSWVLQYDPPTSANAFVHRCGRTARGGSEGRALLLLTPSELAYVNFLQINQKVSVSELQPDEASQLLCAHSVGGVRTCDSVTSQVRRICLKDKLLIEKSIKAFVSYVQFYRKHECHILLSWKKLDFGRLANGFGLLKLPHMPELRAANTSAFNALAVDFAKVKYRQKSVARQRELQQEEARLQSTMNPKPRKNKPWSKKKDLLQKREMARKLKASKRKPYRSEPESTSNIALNGATFDDGDVTELNMDYQRLKKVRKHEIEEEDLESD